MAPEERQRGERLRALIIHPDDNVANLVGSGSRGQTVDCTVEGKAEEETVELVEDLPSNHKLTRRDIPEGEPITKYGLVIGLAAVLDGRSPLHTAPVPAASGGHT